MLLFSCPARAQENHINWLSFEQLEDSLATQPKKVFIDFYADWCAYCKKMDKAAFRDSRVISKLNNDYYAVKMNAETTDTIVFGGETFVNNQLKKKRNPTHEIPLLLASRENYPFSLPAIIVLNQKFEVTERYFEYLSPMQMLEALED
ncbi:thioredoxin family protein [Ulvibacterium sp.]|uniref:thioredoxin family protein n=1 Tax=Ulvibacterium sp. TaxID=2665914 RepID=UPI002618ABDE|nr:thioredoxin family protein [Ulvibacterium sp.]